MKKLLLIAGVFGFALLIYVAAGPFITIHKIEKSIAAQDISTLSDQIDFPAVREDLKRQLNRKLESETPDFIKDIPFAGKILNTLGGKVLEQVIDPMMAGQLLYIMQGNNPDLDFGTRELIKPVPESTSTEKVFKDAKYDYVDSQTFIASVEHTESGTFRFTFRRNGLHWKLSAIELPQLQTAP